MATDVELLNEAEMKRALTRMSYEILERNHGTANLAIVGIKTRGAIIANRIKDRINQLEEADVFYGELDVRAYRDDLDQEKDKLIKDLSQLDFDVNGKHIFICDDVLMTGRTIRATMDALMDHGRPSKISLVTLIDRGHRELPIRADIVGKNIPTSRQEKIRVKMRELDSKDAVYIIK
ncbi:bifunctional pyr operon transcriptional regulator/uracil phosphoribosyltransferase PyrR [Aerococcus mictus]|uniref:bifunctional pyr operon transcriptional regulator/uracil phosphoribosyltransferase PyrR n=1 Tax=Aerococcus mictus TaxID=2976810 RepID=UPI00227D763E|nr:bifunctional pyr operon transcriptional regulator/uracil phosphoribosyltransferase PyrR [Aerococcus mictus]